MQTRPRRGLTKTTCGGNLTLVAKRAAFTSVRPEGRGYAPGLGRGWWGGVPVGIWGVENFSAGQEFNPITAGQSVPDKLNDTLLDPDLTWALCILHYQTPSPLQLITSAHREESVTDTSRERKKERLSFSLVLPLSLSVCRETVRYSRGRSLVERFLRTPKTFLARRDFFIKILETQDGIPVLLFLVPPSLRR